MRDPIWVLSPGLRGWTPDEKGDSCYFDKAQTHDCRELEGNSRYLGL